MDEVKRIIERYERRKKKCFSNGNISLSGYDEFKRLEREEVYRKIIKERFTNIEELRVLEIGAGRGVNIDFFLRLGISYHNIFANELMPERIAILRNRFPDINILEGDARNINENYQFDILLQSLVFTSILDKDFRYQLADKMIKMLKKDGIIIWYDFIYNNPVNKDVRGIKLHEINQLFPSGNLINYYRVTLLPPLGRIAGKAYPVFNRLKFLRTHIIAEIVHCTS